MLFSIKIGIFVDKLPLTVDVKYYNFVFESLPAKINLNFFKPMFHLLPALIPNIK